MLALNISACRGETFESDTAIMPAEQQVEVLSTPTPKDLDPESELRPKDGILMVFIPGGVFQMGSSDSQVEAAIELCKQHYQTCNRWYYQRESPQHQVSLNDFWIDQTEVSNAQYQLCVDAGVCAPPLTCRKGDATFEDQTKSDHPVVCVSWEEARSYCQWVGERLPTEAEWEYAARGEASAIYPWGDQFDGSKLNYCDANCSLSFADQRFDEGFPQTSPVGSFPAGASWAGVLDLGGNVSEWVQDWMGEYQPGFVFNPAGPPEGSERMLKGCSWYAHPTYCRAAARPSVDPETRFDYFGFRCASSEGD